MKLQIFITESTNTMLSYYLFQPETAKSSHSTSRSTPVPPNYFIHKPIRSIAGWFALVMMLRRISRADSLVLAYRTIFAW
ncbi:hypothetical protein ABKN59_009816 [Abortiporus biennis]